MTCAVVGSLAVRGVTFLDMPLVTRETVKGVQVRQRTKPACSAKQLHRPRAVMAARSYGPRRIGVAHDTISSSPLGCGARVLPWSGRELNFWQEEETPRGACTRGFSLLDNQTGPGLTRGRTGVPVPSSLPSKQTKAHPRRVRTGTPANAAMLTSRDFRN